MPTITNLSVPYSLDKTRLLQANFRDGNWILQFLDIVPNPDLRSNNKTILVPRGEKRIVALLDSAGIRAFMQEHVVDDYTERFSTRLTRSYEAALAGKNPRKEGQGRLW